MEWTRPRLVVLGRATPEESVLEVCKNHEMPGQMYSPDSATCGWMGAGAPTAPCRGVTGS